ncbi:MAG: hypothetical protein UW24_C0003G0022 [Parcubacteria group bacterium GW2011_GWA2_44_12]|nr:MAG: hypothetical protein UW24_C0003G0022 [Parcubacteria group bacterium GW2011_GWA2_44_12]
MPIAPLTPKQSPEKLYPAEKIPLASFETGAHPSQEQFAEQRQEKIIPQKRGTGENAPTQSAHTVTASARADDEEKPEDLKNIETILSEGLRKFYEQMNDAEKAEFKQSGEEAARKIYETLNDTKIRLKKIAHAITKLIKTWLGKIRGVNKHFLEQDAKIKTDRLIEMKRRKENLNF